MKAESRDQEAITKRSSTSDDVFRMLAAFAAELPIQGDFIQQLPTILEQIGRTFQLPRIDIRFSNGQLLQDITWEQNPGKDEAAWRRVECALPKSGPRNQVVYYLGADSYPEDVYCLLASILDTRLAAQQLFAIEHSQRELVESINQISKILTSTLDREELLALFLDQLERLTPYDSASVMLLQDGLLYMHAARGYRDFSEPVDIADIAFPPDETFLMNDVLNGEAPVVLNDTVESPNWTWSPVGRHIRSWMGVPLVVDGKAIGLFSLDKSTPNYFTEKHARVASALAKHAALALYNAMLFDRVREAHQELQGLSAKVLAAQEQERQRIAWELHDHSGQALLALRAELQVLQHFIETNPEAAGKQIRYLDEIVLAISKDMERLAYDMRPPALKDVGLATILEDYIKEFSQRMGLKATYAQDIGEMRFSEAVEMACYRIVQEALTNLAKHADADAFEVTLNYFEDLLHLVIRDNGVGMGKPRRQRKGYGLVGIRERLAQIDGKLHVNSRPGFGTELVIVVPVQDVEGRDA